MSVPAPPLPQKKSSEVKTDENSLLDITHPYLKHSMLSHSVFSGFECLMFLIAVHFAVVYMVTNYINKGYILKWDVLQIVGSNLVEDLAAISSMIGFAVVQLYLGDLVIRVLRNMKGREIIAFGYCLLFGCAFVGGGLYLISRVDFYFTDRIFIVVVSWAMPVKTASYCFDRLRSP